jgi:glycosyltransferase involved in cell wall biosynthesis
MCKKGKYLDYKYVLTVGTLFKRRNPQKIISFSTYLFHEANIKTIVVGRFTSIWQQIILKSGTSLNNIEFLGKICDGQLLQLYNSAVGYITFSKDEGFNIPLLDAISFGIPILASEIPAHQELLIDKDAFNEKSFLTKLQNTSSNSQNINMPFNSARNETLELFQLLRTYLND